MQNDSITMFLNLDQQQNKLMYNLHQYNSSVRTAQRKRLQQQNQARYALKHEGICDDMPDLKEKAAEKQKEKVNSFVKQQNQSDNPFVFEDDHYKHWRTLKQFRDIQDTNKFLSFKTFRHRPHYDMDKYFNERQRKEILQLSQRKEHLVQSKLIPEQQRSRSLRCQGPLNPKIEFRQKKKDHQYLQPHLRFSSITDRQRFNQTSLTFDDKFKELYKSFQMTKSKIGQTTISPRKVQPKDSLDFFDDSNITKSRHFYFQKEQSNLQPSENQNESPSLKINPEISQKSTNDKKGKIHFKLAKTMHLLGNDPVQKQQIQNMLKRTQYERKKDLTNIRYNSYHENHLKQPIL